MNKNFLINLTNTQKKVITENNFKDKIIKNNINIELSNEDNKEDIIKKFNKLKDEYNKLNELQEILQLKILCLKNALINEEEERYDIEILDIQKEKIYYDIDKPLTEEDLNYFFKYVYDWWDDGEGFKNDINDINKEDKNFYKKIEKRIKNKFKNNNLSKKSENFIRKNLLDTCDEHSDIYYYLLSYQ